MQMALSRGVVVLGRENREEVCCQLLEMDSCCHRLCNVERLLSCNRASQDEVMETDRVDWTKAGQRRNRGHRRHAELLLFSVRFIAVLGEEGRVQEELRC